MKNQLQIVCFGEVLWDIFPEHQKIGGAPLNVALRLRSFQNSVYMVSRIGKDKIGDDILELMNESGLITTFIQRDESCKTGEVQVTLDRSGAASYEIVFPSAWDFINPK